MTTATSTAQTTDKAITDKSTKSVTSSPASDRARVSYKPDDFHGRLEVSYGAQSLEFDTATDVFSDEDVKDRLAYMGLITYLQRESSRARDEQKLDAIDEAYTRLCAEGMQAFERKSAAPRGPKKADKIAALAMLKGRTPDAVRDAIKKLPPAKQDELLNHPKVLAKVEELKTADEEDLSV